MLRHHLQAESGQVFPVEIRDDGDQVRVRVGEEERVAECAAPGPGELRLRLGDRVFPCHYAREGRALHLWFGGRTWEFTLAEGAHAPRSGSAGGESNRLVAPMPGSVLRVMACPGQEVEAHRTLVIMESMKMEIALHSPRAGRVAEVRCREGQMVEMGSVLVTLEVPPA